MARITIGRVLSSVTDSVRADQGVPNTLVNAWPVKITDGVIVLGTAANPVRVDPTGTTTQPVSAISLPLPTGAATEATLLTRASEATLLTRATEATLATRASEATLVAINGKLNSLGQKTMAGSVPVVLASDQSVVSVSVTSIVPTTVDQGDQGTHAERWMVGLSDGVGFISPATDRILATSPFSIRLSDGAVFYDAAKTTQLPVALVGGRLDTNLGAWLGSTAPTVGQKVMASSVPVVIASDQSPIAVSATFVDDSVGPTGVAVPLEATQVGGPDAAGLLRAPRLFDLDTGGGTEFNFGVNLRKSSGGGSVEFGTLADPVRVDPTGATTQPISAVALPLPAGAATEATLATRLAGATFTARINTLGQKTMALSTPVVIASDQSFIPVSQSGVWTVQQGTPPWSFTSTQLPAALVGGRLDTNIGAWLGSTAPTVGQKTMANSVPVVLPSDQAAIPVTSTPNVVGAEGNAWAAAVVGANGTSASVDCQYSPFVTAFGNVSANTTITMQFSQDNANFYDGPTTKVTGAPANFWISETVGARYVRLKSSAAATITATIAAKD